MDCFGGLTMRFSGRSCVVASVLVLTGCSTLSEPDMGFVQDEWAKGVQRLGRNLFPVYPPSEDYQVGDIYAIGIPCGEDLATVDKKDMVGVRIGTSDPREKIYRSYANRLRFPQTAFADGDKIDRKVEPRQTWPRDAHGPQLTPASIVAFPEFSLASGTLDKFGGTFGNGAFGVIFGRSAKTDTILDVRVKEGETYGIDVVDADDALSRFCSVGRCDDGKIGEYLNRTLVSTPTKKICPGYIMYISRVYMTRQLIYQYSFDTAQAFEVAVSAASATASEKTAQARQEALKKIMEAKLEENAKRDPGFLEASSLRDKIAYDLTNDLQDDLKNLAEAGSNSAFFLSSSYANRSIKLDQVFRRPVVFAYSGITWGGGRHGGSVATAGSVPRQVPGSISPAAKSQVSKKKPGSENE